MKSRAKEKLTVSYKKQSKRKAHC